MWSSQWGGLNVRVVFRWGSLIERDSFAHCSRFSHGQYICVASLLNECCIYQKPCHYVKISGKKNQRLKTGFLCLILFRQVSFSLVSKAPGLFVHTSVCQVYIQGTNFYTRYSDLVCIFLDSSLVRWHKYWLPCGLDPMIPDDSTKGM